MTFFKDEDSAMRQFKLGGVEARVIAGGAFAGVCRSLVESPLDLIKTRRQTGADISLTNLPPLKDLFRGFPATVTRNMLLLSTFFVFLDRLTALSTFARGGAATTAAWTLVWPLDVAKSRLQSVEGSRGSTSLYQALADAARDGTLYRGYAAGITRSFVANGASLAVYQFCQDMRTKYFSNYFQVATIVSRYIEREIGLRG